MADEVKLTPEARDLLDLYAARVQETMTRGIESVRADVHATEDRLTRQMTKIEVTQEKILDTQIEQGKDLVAVKTRLDEGDKRFVEHSTRIAELEKKAEKQGNSVAGIIGAMATGAAGGGITVAIAKVLGH
ncbi:MAG TPA: hypothetical protein VGP72_14670 [Planctomycetota bacterium]|jgi:septal ring factor EnvC (AmiA/AmiB activator)